MHELSLGTWFIHIATLFEWTVAIFLINLCAQRNGIDSLNWLAIAMLPNLASAMAAITWHIFDNDKSLYSLVYLQALLTCIGNTTLAFAAWQIAKSENNSLNEV